MQYNDNFDIKEKDFKEIINICNQYPNDEEMLIIKAKSLKRLEKPHQSLKCLKKLLKINPYNLDALIEISHFLKY